MPQTSLDPTASAPVAAAHPAVFGPHLPAAPAQPEPQAPTPQTLPLFGSFWIDETEFGLPVDIIREVVYAPPTYSEIPLSKPYMMGLFSLRNTIVPVVDLRVLMGFAPAEDSATRKVAIIENGDLCFGLLFDDTGSIINATHAKRVDFQTDDAGVKDVIIEGVLKLDNGKRMVQILDPHALLQLEKLPRVAKTRKEAGTNHLGQRMNCISFQLGHTKCAIDLRYVQEITDIPKIHESQIAHGHIIGNIELRGLTMPIMDFRGVIGNEAPHKFDTSRMGGRKLVILKLPQGHVGMLVFSIDSIMTFYNRDVLPFANIALPRQDLVAGCLLPGDGEIVILLDHEALLQDKGLIQAAQSCREIYPSEEKAVKTSFRSTEAGRETYILFTVHMQLALEVSNVCEIVNRPENLLKPPYVLDFVEGILNLRGELITMINPRTLYSLPDADKQGAKIVILQKEGKKYGIAVDSIDEIVITGSNELLSVPAISEHDTRRNVSQDVTGCLVVPSRGRESDPVFVLDVAALIGRCVEAEAR